MIKPIKKTHLWIAWSAIIVCVFIVIFYIIPKGIASYNELLLIDINARTTELEIVYKELKEEQDIKLLNTLEALQEPIKTEVLFTNYGVWDSESEDITASGHTSKDFIVNELGMYTYQDKIVLATANTSRWNRDLKSGYRSHELYELVTFELDGNVFEGIVLDVCGECMGNEREDFQRYDIYTTSNIVGLSKGYLITGEEND